MKWIPWLIFQALTVLLHAERLDVGWPTPNTAYFDGKSINDFIQSTASGEIESGLFGCHRSGGGQFHEGIDLKATKRDRHGEPADPIFAVMPGIIRHINRQPGDSNYGRYIVIEHMGVAPSVYTLYAHLSAIEPGLKPGSAVERGQTIATMGRSSSGMAIPRDRAHLHFEMGLWLTRDFQSWYDWKKFGSRNDHGVWNGMNLLGFDPLNFYQEFRSKNVEGFQDYLAHMTPAVRLRVATARIPDFVLRYPGLLSKPLSADGAARGWEVTFNEVGIPFAWTPLSVMETMGYRPNEVRVLEADEAISRRNRCRVLALTRRGKLVVGRDLEPILELLFGFREH